MCCSGIVWNKSAHQQLIDCLFICRRDLVMQLITDNIHDKLSRNKKQKHKLDSADLPKGGNHNGFQLAEKS